MSAGRALVGGLAALAFVGFAAVQLNDPDPIAWVAVYGLAAGLGVAHAVGRAPRRLAWAFSAICLLWALTLVPAGLGAPPRAIVTDLAMHAPGVEEAREALGLLIAAAWGVAVARSATRRELGGAHWFL